jgi:hypothetical protein
VRDAGVIATVLPVVGEPREEASPIANTTETDPWSRDVRG